jgi:hypothetical protein
MTALPVGTHEMQTAPASQSLFTPCTLALPTEAQCNSVSPHPYATLRTAAAIVQHKYQHSNTRVLNQALPMVLHFCALAAMLTTAATSLSAPCQCSNRHPIDHCKAVNQMICKVRVHRLLLAFCFRFSHLCTFKQIERQPTLQACAVFETAN